MATKKTSVAIGQSELAAAKKAAAAEGLSLSAFLTALVAEHVAQQKRFEAMGRYVATFAPSFKLTEKARTAIEDEWTAPLAPIRAKRKRSAA